MERVLLDELRLKKARFEKSKSDLDFTYSVLSTNRYARANLRLFQLRYEEDARDLERWAKICEKWVNEELATSPIGARDESATEPTS